MKNLVCLASILTAYGVAASPAQQAPQQISDLSSGDEKSTNYAPEEPLIIGELFFFFRYTPTLGSELWRTDGTVEGTRLVKDIVPGVQSGVGGSEGVVSGDTLYFTGQSVTARGQQKLALWKTDGTEEGTVPVKTLWRNDEFQSLMGAYTAAPDGGAYFFSIDTSYNDGSDMMRLWRTDGTEEGTTSLVNDFYLDAGGIVAVGNTVWLGGEKLWRTDGTQAGTVPYGPPSVQPNVQVLWAMEEDKVLFASNPDQKGGMVLQRLDATGITPLRKIGIPYSNPRGPTLLGGDIHFLTYSTEGDLLWRSDGTETGTALVKALPGRVGYFSRMTEAGGKIYFRAVGDGINETSSYLWRSDGTEAGTFPLKKDNSYNSNIAELNGTVYFIHPAEGGNCQLWSTDGTVAGTKMVTDLANTVPNNRLWMGVTSSALIICGDSAIWSSDGTAAGTTMMQSGSVRRVLPISGITAEDEQVFFSAYDETHGRKIWTSDGTAAGTVKAPESMQSAVGSAQLTSSTVVMDGIHYFAADDGKHGRELWRSDGLAGAKQLVKDINPGTVSSSPTSLTIFNGAVWFTAQSSPFLDKAELWRTDGTEEGTVRVSSLGVDGTADWISLLGVLNGSLYVNFSDSYRTPEATRGLWCTDGTPEGTVRLINKGAHSILQHAGQVYFWTNWSLWKTDGTPTGTVLLHQFSSPTQLFSIGGKLLALKNDSGTYWLPGGLKQDGGLLQVHDGTSPDLFRQFDNHEAAATLGGVLYFSVTVPDTDAGLWRSDGTEEGTYLLHALTIRGPITAHGGKLYFNANDGIHGEEPWVSDGTVAGTRMVADLTGDSGGSNPNGFTSAGEKLFFAATTESHGQQLYVIDNSGAPTPYDLWLENHRAGMNGKTARGEDADEDGFTNLQEFAFGGNPAEAGDHPLITSSVRSVSGQEDEKYLSLTTAVRRGTVFTPGSPLTGTGGGVTYRLLATAGLEQVLDGQGLLEVVEDSLSQQPAHEDEDYEYRTFRMKDPVNSRDKAFIRINVD